MTTPLSEVLGSTKEETSASIKAVIGPTFKGITKKMELVYEPLSDDEKLFKGGDEVIYQRRCNICVEIAEHKATTEADPYYIQYLCTVCRDKATQGKVKKDVREPKMIRYAGYNRRMPSITAETLELIKKAQEAKANDTDRGNGSGESESTAVRSPEVEGTSNQPDTNA